MSWATIGRNQSEDVQVNEKVRSEEAILHDLRSRYSQALQSLSRSSHVDDDAWQTGVIGLEGADLECSAALEGCPMSRAAIVEISYLVNRNRIECIGKQGTYPLAAAYKLSLGTLQMMVELRKTDILLVLQTARYAREMKDIWTYQQLMLQYSSQLPYLYRDLVLDEFATAMQKEDTLTIQHPPALHIDKLVKKEPAEKDVGEWRLCEYSAPAFLRFVLDKVRTGRDETCAQLLEGWQEAWIAAAEDENGDAMPVDEAGSVTAREIASSPVTETADGPSEEAPAPPPQLAAQEDVSQAEKDMPAPISVALAVETSALPGTGKAGDDAPESTGRRSKRARNPTLAAVEAIAAAIPEGRRRSAGASTAGEEEAPKAGIPVAVLPAARTSSADCASDIFVALKKLFSEDAALFGDWRPDVTATECADMAQRQAAALRAAFSLPHAVLALFTSNAAAEGASCGVGMASSPTRLSSPLRTGQVVGDSGTYADVAAPVFSAFCALLGAGDSGLTERMILYAKVIEALVAPRHWHLLRGLQGLDEVVLRSWRRLAAIHPGGAQALLSRLTTDEELVLLESAVSYTTVREERATPVDSELWATAKELTLSILGSSSGGCAGPDKGVVLLQRESFWTRFVGQTEHRARALWVAVVASRQIAVTDLPANSTREVLTTLAAELGDLSIVLPHVASHRWNRIDRKGCEELLNALKHEGETADLVRRCAASSAWVTKALALVRSDGQLRAMLSERSETAAAGPSSSGAGNARSSQTPCLPALLLQTCRKLDDPTVGLQTVTALLDEATQLLSGRVDFADGADLQWLKELFDHIVVNWVAVPAEPGNDEHGALQERVICQACTFLLASVSAVQAQSAAEALALRCIELARLLCGNSAARILFQNTAFHAILAMSESPSARTASPVLLNLWGFLAAELGDGRLEMPSDPAADAWAQLVKLAVTAWQSLEAAHAAPEASGQLYAFVLHLGANVGNHLSRRALGELLLVLHRALRQQAELAALRSTGTKSTKRSNHAMHSTTIAQSHLREKQQRALLTKQLTAALEGLVMHRDFPTEFPQREQRPLVIALGQLYYASYGFLLFLGGEGSDDEEEVDADFTAPVLLQLYAFTQLCTERGWANKAEIRAATLQLSRAPVLRVCLSSYGRPLTTPLLFATTDAVELLRDLDRSASAAQTVSDPTGLLTVASEIFHALLALGVTAADLEGHDDADETTVASDSAGAYAAGLLMTTLRKECDLGDCFADQRAAFVVDSCLRDLCVNPLRWSSWQELLGQVMEGFNALCDELQKEVILTALPVQCFEFCSDLHSVLLPRIEADGTSLQICVWNSTAPITRATAAEFIEHIIASIESAVGGTIHDIFASALARETISTRQGNPVSDSHYAAHLRRLAVMLALRNASLALVLRMNDLMQHARDAAVMAPAEDDDGDEAQQSAEQLSLVLSNAAKALPKLCPLRAPLQEQISQCLSRDWYFGDDLYALSTASRVVWSRAVAPLASITPQGLGNTAMPRSSAVLSEVCTAASEALALSTRAATALRSEIAARGGLSKPTRIVVTYHICNVCLKASLVLLQHFSSAILLPAAHALLGQVLECLGIMFKGHRRLALLTEWSDCYDEERGEASNLSDPERSMLSRVWCALSVGVHGLKECRKLDAFDFRSVYRLSSTISALGALLSARPEVTPPQCVMDDLRGMGVSQLEDTCALRELSKLFDRKRPQIVAMWCVESAATAFEKKLVRISQFDVLRKKYIDQYLHLAAQCGEVEVVLDVLAFALAAAKHATAVVVHVLHSAVHALHRTVRAVLLFLNEEDSVEQAASKCTTLISGATRVLQMTYELHCQLQGRLSLDAQTALAETVALLYPHSSLYTPVSPRALPASEPALSEAIDTESPPAVLDAWDAPPLVTFGGESAGDPAAGADTQDNAAEVSQRQSPAQEQPAAAVALAACALKWAAYAKQLPRTEIGRRGKGYFLLLSAPERAQSSSSGGVANLAASTDVAEGESATTNAVEPEAAGVEGEGEGEGEAARDDQVVRSLEPGGTETAVAGVALQAAADEVLDSYHGGEQGDRDVEPVTKVPRLGI